MCLCFIMVFFQCHFYFSMTVMKEHNKAAAAPSPFHPIACQPRAHRAPLSKASLKNNRSRCAKNERPPYTWLIAVESGQEWWEFLGYLTNTLDWIISNTGKITASLVSLEPRNCFWCGSRCWACWRQAFNVTGWKIDRGLRLDLGILIKIRR